MIRCDDWFLVLPKAWSPSAAADEELQPSMVWQQLQQQVSNLTSAVAARDWASASTHDVVLSNVATQQVATIRKLALPGE